MRCPSLFYVTPGDAGLIMLIIVAILGTALHKVLDRAWPPRDKRRKN